MSDNHMSTEEMQGMISYLQQRLGEVSSDYEGRLAMLHLQYSKQIQQYKARVEELTNAEEKEESDGS